MRDVDSFAVVDSEEDEGSWEDMEDVDFYESLGDPEDYYTTEDSLEGYEDLLPEHEEWDSDMAYDE